MGGTKARSRVHLRYNPTGKRGGVGVELGRFPDYVNRRKISVYVHGT